MKKIFHYNQYFRRLAEHLMLSGVLHKKVLCCSIFPLDDEYLRRLAACLVSSALRLLRRVGDCGLGFSSPQDNLPVRKLLLHMDRTKQACGNCDSVNSAQPTRTWFYSASAYHTACCKSSSADDCEEMNPTAASLCLGDAGQFRIQLRRIVQDSNSSLSITPGQYKKMPDT